MYYNLKIVARILLFPIMAMVELLLLVVGWAFAIVNLETAAEWIICLADRLPDLKWYLPKK